MQMVEAAWFSTQVIAATLREVAVRLQIPSPLPNIGRLAYWRLAAALQAVANRIAGSIPARPTICITNWHLVVSITQQ